ncbi:MAG: hypothetical protein LBJ90_03715 [Treponema sp.]|jgi:hypothetical protein|nr:hypothetical protein [Treponema sp.]
MKNLRVFAFALSITFLILPGTGRLYAMDWPVREGALSRNFGWNNGGKPVLGNVFETEAPVLAAEGGEVIFFRTGGDTASRLPSPLGAWTAVDHDDGLVSVYSRYDENSGGKTGKGESGGRAGAFRVERGEAIAAAGVSGWSAKGGVYFTLFDRRERRWVNPSTIITPLPDTRPPAILSVRLENAGGQLIDPGGTRYLSQGVYTVSVAAADTRLNPGESALAPHRISCSVNGIEISSLNFETFSTRDGALMAYRNGLVPAKQVYAPFPAFEVGKVPFTRGQANLEIVVQDIAGNSRSVVFRILVE